MSALRLVVNENDLELVYLVRDMARESYLQPITGEELVSFVIKGNIIKSKRIINQNI